MTTPQRDLARDVLGVLAIGGLILASVWVLRPFIGPAIWAATIVITTWPLLLRLQRGLGGSRGWAVVVFSLALLALFILPALLVLLTLAGNFDEIVAAIRQLAAFRLPPAPDWVLALPILGTRLGDLWNQVAATGSTGLLARATPYFGTAAQWVVREIGEIGYLLVQSLLVLVLAALMFASGEDIARATCRAGRRLAGERGDNSVLLAAQAIRGVALGVGITAAVQSLIGGVGLAMAGVPWVGPLMAAMLVLSVAQIGPLPVLVPAALWLVWSGQTGWGIFLGVVCVGAGVVDNVLRPLLIRMGADLPILLMFAGVVGGLLGFGLVGIFVGPVVLAVAYRLAEAWIDDEPPPPVIVLPEPTDESRHGA